MLYDHVILAVLRDAAEPLFFVEICSRANMPSDYLIRDFIQLLDLKLVEVVRSDKCICRFRAAQPAQQELL